MSRIYSLVLLIVIVGTGTILSLPILKELVEQVSPLYKPGDIRSSYSKGANRISLDQTVSIALSHFPTASVNWIETPKDTSGSYRINLRQSGDPSPRFPKTDVWVEQYNGKVLSIRDVTKDSSGDTFLRWLHPLHSGEAFGLTDRIIVCISGIIPLLLYITGFIRWRQKQQVKGTHKNTCK